MTVCRATGFVLAVAGAAGVDALKLQMNSQRPTTIARDYTFNVGSTAGPVTVHDAALLGSRGGPSSPLRRTTGRTTLQGGFRSGEGSRKTVHNLMGRDGNGSLARPGAKMVYASDSHWTAHSQFQPQPVSRQRSTSTKVANAVMRPSMYDSPERTFFPARPSVGATASHSVKEPTEAKLRQRPVLARTYTGKMRGDLEDIKRMLGERQEDAGSVTGSDTSTTTIESLPLASSHEKSSRPTSAGPYDSIKRRSVPDHLKRLQQGAGPKMRGPTTSELVFGRQLNLPGESVSQKTPTAKGLLVGESRAHVEVTARQGPSGSSQPLTRIGGYRTSTANRVAGARLGLPY